MAAAASVNLSRGDRAVLSALFDPESSLQNHAIIDTETTDLYSPGTVANIMEQERTALLIANQDHPTKSNVQDAISKFSNIIETYPEYASAWNNRAQATRMLFDAADIEAHPVEVRSIFHDLSQAIKLASPQQPLAGVTPTAARVLASAHTHRGYLLWRTSRSEIPQMLDAVEELNGVDKTRLEELASRDFALGGRFGNEAARELAVKTNPYAKLCGSIVREAMQKEIRDFSQQSPVARAS